MTHFPIANHILRSSVLVVISLFKSLLKINNFPYKLMPRRKVIISFYDKIKYFNYSTNIPKFHRSYRNCFIFFWFFFFETSTFSLSLETEWVFVNWTAISIELERGKRETEGRNIGTRSFTYVLAWYDVPCLTG